VSASFIGHRHTFLAGHNEDISPTNWTCGELRHGSARRRTQLGRSRADTGRNERSSQVAHQHGTGPTAGWSRADQVQVGRGGTRCGNARGRTQLGRSRANRVRVGAEPTNAADQHGTGPIRARPEPGRPSAGADRARLRRSGPPSAVDQHGTKPTPGWSWADRSSSSCCCDGSSGKQQQLAGAECSIAPHAASPDGAGPTLRPDPARAARLDLRLCAA
jgi:hypothetical protein